MESSKFFEKYNTFDKVFDHFLELEDSDALLFFCEFVDNLAESNNISKSQALECGKKNFGYFSGYYSLDIQERTQHLLETEHPIFGKVEDYKDKDSEYFFNLGKELGEKRK